jgi:hypothetical protein
MDVRVALPGELREFHAVDLAGEANVGAQIRQLYEPLSGFGPAD